MRAKLLRKAFPPGTEVVGATGQGILLHLAQAVVVVQALEDQIPESDQRSESPLVEGFFRNRQPGGQPGCGQELVEDPEQLWGGKARAQQRGRRRGKLGSAVRDVFLDDIMYAYISICILYLLYLTL